MDKKLSVGAVIGSVVTAVAVLLVTTLIKDTGEDIDAGKKAETVLLIKEVMREENSVPVNGSTLTTSEALSLILGNQAAMQTELAVVSKQLEILTED